MKIGYACINTQLSPEVTTNRSMIKKTFKSKGVDYASELAFKNVQDLQKILEWNEQNGFKFFRISSDLFPWASEYDLKDLPHFNDIKQVLQAVGKFAKDNDHRLTFHPGPFNKLASPKEDVIQNTIRDLTIHGEIFDLMELSQTPYNKINIHVGAHYNDKPMAISNFIKNFCRLPYSVKSRLTIENDDKESLYSVKELVPIHEKTGIPIVFDYHHHKFCNGGQTEEEALKTAARTWFNITPVVHYSESKCLESEENKNMRPQAHSDYVNGPIETYGEEIDIMIEAKMKEQAAKGIMK